MSARKIRSFVNVNYRPTWTAILGIAMPTKIWTRWFNLDLGEDLDPRMEAWMSPGVKREEAVLSESRRLWIETLSAHRVAPCLGRGAHKCRRLGSRIDMQLVEKIVDVVLDRRDLDA
jgi:hypothetical protein